MSVVQIRTNFNIHVEFETAPFHRRLLAWFLDMVLLIVSTVVFIRLFGEFIRDLPRPVRVVTEVVLILLLIGYHLIFEIFMNGQSIGKRITGIRVVNDMGGQPAVGQYIIRWIIRTGDFTVLVILLSMPGNIAGGELDYLLRIGVAGALLLTDIILVNTGRQQRLGDILAHTLLITTRNRQSIHDTIFLDISGEYTPSFPQVMQLTDKDINSLKAILDTARRRNDFELAAMAAEKIKSHLKIDTSLAPFDFLEVLLKDYNYISSN